MVKLFEPAVKERFRALEKYPPVGKPAAPGKDGAGSRAKPAPAGTPEAGPGGTKAGEPAPGKGSAPKPPERGSR